MALETVPEHAGSERHPVVYGQGIVAQFSSEWIRLLTVRQPQGPSISVLHLSQPLRNTAREPVVD